MTSSATSIKDEAFSCIDTLERLVLSHNATFGSDVFTSIVIKNLFYTADYNTWKNSYIRSNMSRTNTYENAYAYDEVNQYGNLLWYYKNVVITIW